MAVQASALSKGALERLERTRITERYALGRTLLRVAGVVAIGYLIRAAIGDLAGQETTVTVSTALSVLADLKLTLAISIAGGTGIWALAERRLRLRKTEKLQNRIISLEEQIDRRRSSSRLTPTGNTNPRDKRK